MTLFDLSSYSVRQLDPAQGTKPLDFGGGGITGSINLDGRFIAINTYHPEHGYITLTSIPPFPDEDRYDQAKVRAYRKSLVHNQGFGLQFEQDIIKREYFLIEDAVPFIRFTLADGTIAECITIMGHQLWQFSDRKVQAKITGQVQLKRVAYTQLTEGGIKDMPGIATDIVKQGENYLLIDNHALKKPFELLGFGDSATINNGKLVFDDAVAIDELSCCSISVISYFFEDETDPNLITSDWIKNLISEQTIQLNSENSLLINRAVVYGLFSRFGDCMLTDHMILPLLWTRDSYYVVRAMCNAMSDTSYERAHIQWIFRSAWKGTFCKSVNLSLPYAWGRAYMANGMAKDNKAFQLDQQIFPFLALADYVIRTNDTDYAQKYVYDVEQFDLLLRRLSLYTDKWGLYPTDETPADDEIPLHYHFSTHILLWHTLKKLQIVYDGLWIYWDDSPRASLSANISYIQDAIPQYFITEHNGKKIYSYATDGEDNHYIYHDANDIPLVMMPLWGFCDKDDEIWLNTIGFAFSEDNPGFFDGVLGSVHSPAPWALGDAQELIFCKVVGDRERYQRVWERLEKVAQWDGALPEAYNIDDYSVYSRHWFAWPNAMVAIADSISWDWETEGEYAR